LTACAFCGRENDAGSRFCIDCGKPMNASAARVIPAHAPSSAGGQPQPQQAVATASAPPGFSAGETACGRCGKGVDPTRPFCSHCGARVSAKAEPGTCGQCGASYAKGVDLFCSRCGTRVGDRVAVESPTPGAASRAPGGTAILGSSRMASAGPRLSLISESGEVSKTFTLERGEAVIGRGDADIKFEKDHFMSPLHARIELRSGALCLRDLGSRNGTWVFIEQPTKLIDGDLILIGSQVIRFRRLGYPGPHPPEADSTRRMGSAVPTVDIAVCEQLRADASVRDVFHLSPGRRIEIGRAEGDWLFPYDQTMSGRHAAITSEDSEFFVHDAESRNGVAMAVRGDRTLHVGQRLLVGDQILRVESV
jgi:pSer/pThr/pTyr-binding forkhead associated (FHA) protein